MSMIIKLEKKLEVAFERLEKALVNKTTKQSEHIDVARETEKLNTSDNSELINRVKQLEKNAKDDAAEIDKLINKLIEIVEK